MLELECGVGVMGDASYLAPESVGQGSTPLCKRQPPLTALSRRLHLHGVAADAVECAADFVRG